MSVTHNEQRARRVFLPPWGEGADRVGIAAVIQSHQNTL